MIVGHKGAGKRIAVYFASGNKAVFDADKVDFRGEGEYPLPDVTYSGVVLINWENVCFVKEVEEPHDDE